MAFSPAHLLQILQDLPSPRRYLIALSGGCDSTVLLQVMAALRADYIPELIAVHVNHGLQDDASIWAEHCEVACRSLNVPLIQLDLGLRIAKGESVEAVARHARYQAIKKQMVDGDMLLTAHHQDDQAETVLLQLLRGSGPSGLAAMPQWTTFGCGFHARPLLGFSREQLHGYASAEELSWIDDTSNRDTRYDRNFLRQEVLPALVRRWPAMARTLSRSASHCAEAQRLIDEMAMADLEGMQDEGEGALLVEELSKLPAPRRRAVLRAWIRAQGFQVPDTARLDRLQDEMLNAASDRAPMIYWPGVEVRRYQGRLFLMNPLPRHDPERVFEWDGQSPLELPSSLGTLNTDTGIGGIDPDKWSEGHIQVRFRCGGERCRLVGRGHSHGLKKLLQEQGLPPWQRDRLPLIYIDDQLAAVGDLWVCQPFFAGKGNPGILIVFNKCIP